MTSTLPWFRMYHEARTDAKLRSLADDEFRVWFNLLCYAAEQGTDRGTIECIDGFLLSIEVAGGDEELLRRTLQKLERLRIIQWNGDANDPGDCLTFCHFNDRQYDKPSDHPDRVSERVKRHRAANVTPVKRDVTPSNALEEIRVDKTRVEKSRTTTPPTPSKPDEDDSPAAPVREAYPAEFENVWTQIPTGHGSKKKTHDQWRKLKPAERDELLAVMPRWAASDRWQRGFVKDPAVWLRDGYWRNPPVANAAPKTNGKPTSTDQVRASFSDYFADKERRAAAEKQGAIS